MLGRSVEMESFVSDYEEEPIRGRYCFHLILKIIFLEKKFPKDMRAMENLFKKQYRIRSTY